MKTAYIESPDGNEEMNLILWSITCKKQESIHDLEVCYKLNIVNPCMYDPMSGGDLFYMLERYRMISCFGHYEFQVHQYPFLVNYKYLFDRLNDPSLCDTDMFVDISVRKVHGSR
jgi:hypothetical protein